MIMKKKRTSEFLYAQAIGEKVLNYLGEETVQEYCAAVDSEAVRLIDELLELMDDPILSDWDCFERMEAVIRTFYVHGLRTNRHIECE